MNAIQFPASIAAIPKDWLPYIIGSICLIVLIWIGVSFFSRRRKQRLKAAQREPQAPGRGRSVQDSQGKWWYQDPITGTWYFWDGQAWQLASITPQLSDSKTDPSYAYSRKQTRKSHPLMVLLLVLLGFFVVGSISLAAFGYIPGYQIQVGRGEPNQILIMGGGGLLITIFGFLLFNGGLKTITTRRTTLEKALDQHRENRGSGAKVSGFGKLIFGTVCFMGGLILLSLAFYQEIFPWLGY